MLNFQLQKDQICPMTPHELLLLVKGIAPSLTFQLLLVWFYYSLQIAHEHICSCQDISEALQINGALNKYCQRQPAFEGNVWPAR